MEFSNDKKIIIAIDGYSSCGKSTFAKRIAALLGYVFIDTGAMYRAITLYVLRDGSAIKGDSIDPAIVKDLLPKISITFKFNSERGASDIYVNGERVEDEIRTLEVSSWVSKVSQISSVRETLVALQQKMGEQKGVVMDGRDIGTVVFPNAELKIFMTADPKVRAERRYRELIAKGDDVNLDEIVENINLRDQQDREREISPLRKATDALVLDNSNMTEDEQMTWFEGVVRMLI